MGLARLGGGRGSGRGGRGIGLDRTAAAEAFGDYLNRTSFTVAQVRFVNLIVDELTANGVMEPGRLFESPYTDHAPTGPDSVFGLQSQPQPSPSASRS